MYVFSVISRSVDEELFEPKGQVDVASKDELVKRNHKWDVFLSHAWGPEVDGKKVGHEQAKWVKHLLEDNNLTVWFDEEVLLNQVTEEIVDGMNSSAVVLVLLTETYQERAGKNTNVRVEFKHATGVRGDSVICVCLTPDMKPNQYILADLKHNLYHYLIKGREHEGLAKLLKAIRKHV